MSVPTVLLTFQLALSRPYLHQHDVRRVFVAALAGGRDGQTIDSRFNANDNSVETALRYEAIMEDVRNHLCT